MKVSLRWLEEFITLPTLEIEELADIFTMLGHEVEGIEHHDADWSDVVVGRVEEISGHPDADRIRVCQVETGAGTTEIVCGAWNFDVGAIVPVAVPGAVLPGDFSIERREIRGVVSNGMICSERELGLGEDHEGILVLDDSFRVGSQFSDAIEAPDVVFDLSITPNRPDAMSMLGVARDLAAHLGAGYRVPPLYWKPVAGRPSVSVDIVDRVGCRRFTVREIREVTVGRSPFRVRHRLRKAGVRPISNVVDATNYVMLELGHPLHAFDADTIVGDRLTVRRASEGESLVTLDGEERVLTPDDLIIYDGAGPTSMSGTMGGARSEVTGMTTRVTMEAASWDPPTIMYMARRHDLRSEASTRFERGVDFDMADVANQRASALVAKWGHGQVLEEEVDAVGTRVRPVKVELHLSQVDQLLGPGITADEVEGILERLGMDVMGADPMVVTVPTFRPDVTRPADLVEEVARIHGYDRFEPSLPTGPAGSLTGAQRRRRKVMSVLVGAGLVQAIDLPFVSVRELQAMGVPADREKLLTIRNPLREEESKLRPTLLPGLLSSVRRNLSHGADTVALFEVGSVFSTERWPEDPRLPDQREHLAWAVSGEVGLRRLGSAESTADAPYSLALCRMLASEMGVDVEIRQGAPAGYHPTRSAEILIGGEVVGAVGELSPSAARRLELPGRVAIGEIVMEPLLEPRSPTPASSPSVYPHVDFDLSFLIDRDLPAARLLEVTSEAAGELLESASVFDQFMGLGEGRRALAIRYRMRAPDRTLTTGEIAEVRAGMIDAASALGAELRGA